MGIVIRNSIWMSLIQYAGILLGYINTVILFPNYLDSDQYGLTRILLFVTIVISQFAQFGTPNMVIRFFPILDKKVLTFGLWISSFGLLLFLGLLFALRTPITSLYIKNSALFVDYFYLLVPFSIAMVFYNLFDAYLKALFRNIISASMPFVVLRLFWMVLILGYAYGWLNFEQFIIAYSFSYCFIAFITLSYIFYLKQIPTTWTFDKEDQNRFKEIARFNSFNLLSGISSFMITKVDVLMLGSYEGLTIVAIYTIAVSMASVIRVPSASIARTAPSLIAQYFKANRLGEIHDLYKKSAINQLITSAIVFILIILNYNLLLSFLPDKYETSYILFIYLGLAQVIDTGVGVNGHIMINSKYFQIDALFSILLLLMTVSSNLILIPIFGASGAALATLLSITIYNILRWAYLQFKMKLSPFTNKTIVAVGILLFSLIVGLMLPLLSNLWLDSFLRSCIFILLVIPGIYFSKVSPELNKLLITGIRFFS